MSGTTLKFMMAILMVLDHIGYFVPPEVGEIFHVLTRCVGVFFCYMAVEGFHYTRNRKSYLLRLTGMAIFMEIGNRVINWLIQNPAIVVHNNIFLTLATGIAMLYLISLVSKQSSGLKKSFLILASILVLALGIIFTEGGMVELPFMLITYLCRNKPKVRNVLYLVMSVVLFSMSFVSYPTLYETLDMLAYNSDFMFITVLPFIYLYNGKRGMNNLFSKYFFYFFYPIHLWLIALLSANLL